MYLVSPQKLPRLINWLTNGKVLFDEQTDATLITGGRSSAVGGFLQLIYLGEDGMLGTFDVFEPDGLSSMGVGADDQAVDTSFVGKGFAMNRDGRFGVSFNNASLPIGSLFSIRIFTDPSPMGVGNIPKTGFYGTLLGDVPNPFASTQDPLGIGVENFQVTSAFSANIPVIPEPSVIAFLLAGMMTIVCRRRRK